MVVRISRAQLSGACEVQRNHRVFELVVEIDGFFGIVRAVLDGPAGDAFDAALDPPAVEDRQAGHAVQRGLHAAGAGGFVGTARSVDPDIHARGEERAQLPGVVLEIDDLQQVAGELGRLVEYLADERLARLVLGMRLAGEEDLQAAGFAAMLASRSGSVNSRLARL